MLHLSSLKPASLLLSCLAVAACGGGSSAPTPASSPTTCGEGSTIAGQIIGVWQRQCSDNGGGSYEILVRTFNTNGTYSETTRDYSDAACTSSTGLTITVSGTYILGPTITTSSGLTANEIDIEIVPLAGGGTNTIYDIVRFDATSSQLYLSRFGGFTPTSRPDALDLVAYHVCK